MKQILIIAALFLGLAPLSAQTQQAWIDAAEKAYEREDYYSAYKYYEIAVEFDSSRFDLWYRYAQSAQRFTAYKTAERIYQRVLFSPWRDSFPNINFELAEAKQSLGDYEGAAVLYQYFLDKQPNAPADMRAKAAWGVTNSNWAAEAGKNKRETVISHYPGDINSPYSDFGLTKRGDTTYFSSMRVEFKNDTLIPVRRFNKIFRKIGEEPSRMMEDKEINVPNRHAANLAFTPSGKRVYFSLCDFVDNTELRCELYACDIAPNGRWSEPVKQSVNVQGYTVNHPHVARDPRTGQEYLYFASDCPGTVGGLDLWRCTLAADGTLGAPENLADVNTRGDDVTPFFYEPTQTLYFSSNGRLTFGGYDIYRSGWTGDEWLRPENMGLPVNSSYNDLYYSILPVEELAYFASNRPDSAAVFWDETKEACCFDIYTVDAGLRIRLLALTYDKTDNSELSGATVELYEITPDGQLLLASRYNPDSNDFRFDLEPAKRYFIKATRPGYSTATATLDLTDPLLANKTEIEQRLYLEPGPRLEVSTFNKIDSSQLAGCTVYLYEITPAGERILVDSIVNPDGNKFSFPLAQGKKYEVIGRKPGFQQDLATIDLNDPAYAGKRVIEQDLYLEPGLQLQAYTFRSLDRSPLDQARVQLWELDDNGERVRQIPGPPTATGTDNNEFTFPIGFNKRYLLYAERDGYGPVTDTVDLRNIGPVASGVVKRNLYLGQLLEINTFDASNSKPLNGVELELIRMTPEGPVTVAKDINLLGNQFNFTVDLDQPYKVIARRKGYEELTDTLEFTPEDLVRGGGKLKFDLYLRPISLEEFLPLQLFFDNDYPDPKSYSTTTAKNYIETNEAYYNRKQEFIQTFTEGMPANEAFLARRGFNDFFEREVRGRRGDLELFASKLLEYLQDGNAFTLTLKGFSSPRASNEYNRRLSARRIVSVRNYFERYESGALLPYIRNGRLRFETEALGESQADKIINDRLDNPRESVFGLGASAERRVDIISATAEQ